MRPIVFNNLAVFISRSLPKATVIWDNISAGLPSSPCQFLPGRYDPMARELENALTLPDTPVQIKTEASAPAALHGSVMVLIQFDVCEEIRLDRLREIFSARTVKQPSFKHPAPGYVRYQRPPVVEPIEPLVLESDE